MSQHLEEFIDWTVSEVFLDFANSPANSIFIFKVVPFLISVQSFRTLSFFKDLKCDVDSLSSKPAYQNLWFWAAVVILKESGGLYFSIPDSLSIWELIFFSQEGILTQIFPAQVLYSCQMWMVEICEMLFIKRSHGAVITWLSFLSNWFFYHFVLKCQTSKNRAVCFFHTLNFCSD